MKNNIRYKSNTNNASVIIFFNRKSKLPAMVLCLGEPPGRFLLLLFIFDLHFISLLFICRCSSFVLLFDVIPFPSVDYRQVFTPILYFHPSPSQSDSRHFHFQLFRDLLTASATVLSGRLLPTGVFYLMLLH